MLRCNFWYFIIGVNEAIVAYLWWGFVTAMYYKQLDQFPPMELLTGRVLGGVPLMLLLIALPPGIGRLIEVIHNRRTMAMLALSTVCISLNWLTFIYAVIENRLMEASIGYFINPLVTVMLGRIFLGERLNLTKSIAVGIADQTMFTEPKNPKRWFWSAQLLSPPLLDLPSGLQAHI